jgi:hypothetical protein
MTEILAVEFSHRSVADEDEVDRAELRAFSPRRGLKQAQGLASRIPPRAMKCADVDHARG